MSRPAAWAMTTPMLPARPWANRATMSSSMVGLTAHSPEVRMYATMPTSRMPRRPKRSDKGPATSCPPASPIRQAVTVSCATEVAAPRSAASAGSAGRYRSMEIGPKTVSRSRSTGSTRPKPGRASDVSCMIPAGRMTSGRQKIHLDAPRSAEDPAGDGSHSCLVSRDVLRTGKQLFVHDALHVATEEVPSAEMLAAPESLVILLVAFDVESVRLIEVRLIAVGRRDNRLDDMPLGDADTSEFGVLRRLSACGPNGGDPSKAFENGVRNPARRILAHQSPLIRFEEPQRGGGCRVARLLHPAQQDDLHCREDVILVARGSALAVGPEHVRKHGLVGRAGQLLEHRQKHIVDLLCGGIGDVVDRGILHHVRGTLSEHLEPADERLAIDVRVKAHHVAQGLDTDGLEVFGDEIGASSGCQFFDVAPRDRPNGVFDDLGDRPRLQLLVDACPEVIVDGSAHERDHRVAQSPSERLLR